MTTNAIAISRGLVSAGMDQKVADAVAEAVVTHSDETFPTKSDIARLEGKIESLERGMTFISDRIKLLTNLVIGLYIGLALLFVDKLVS